jgi:hypothetical protein
MELTACDINACTPVFSVNDDGVPSMTLYYKGARLTENTDYTVQFTPTTLQPEETCTVEVTGQSKFTGSRTLTYKVEQERTPLTADMFTLSQSQYDYTGDPCVPTVTCSLEEGTDYVVIGYFDNVNAGKAYLEIAGQGKYSGSVKLAYAIRPVEADAITLGTSISEGGLNSYPYNGKAQYPEINPQWTPGVGEAQAVPESDYTISYGGDLDESGQPVNAGSYTVVVSFHGNFTGTKSVSYEIKKIPLTITPQNVSVDYNAEPQYTASATGLVESETLSSALSKPVLYRCDYHLAGHHADCCEWSLQPDALVRHCSQRDAQSYDV